MIFNHLALPASRSIDVVGGKIRIRGEIHVSSVVVKIGELRFQISIVKIDIKLISVVYFPGKPFFHQAVKTVVIAVDTYTIIIESIVVSIVFRYCKTIAFHQYPITYDWWYFIRFIVFITRGQRQTCEQDNK